MREREREREREMSGDRVVERDEFGREIVYVSGKDIPCRPKWNMSEY